MEKIDKVLMATTRELRNRNGYLVAFIPRLEQPEPRGPSQDESRFADDFDRHGMREVQGRSDS